ncbi:predicted protein, partial [Nematostella vectensis]
MPEALIKVRFNAASATIDEKWRGEEFVALKQRSIKTGEVTDEDYQKLKQILKEQDVTAYKQAAYHTTLYSTPGGDTKQVDMTANYLRELGVEVDICLTNQPIDYSKYDLLHFFNIIRPADILKHVEKANKPYVVSTIFLDYGEFEKKTRGGIMKWMNKIFSEDQIEYIKAIARRLKNGEKIGSNKYLLWGHRKSIKYVAKHSGLLLPNSENEYRRFEKKYGLSHAYHVIPNGIDTSVAERVSKHNPKYENAILCVARIEGRKNQLNLIRALNNTGYRVQIHGKPSPNNIGYFEQCKTEAADNVYFSDWLTEEELYEMYHSAK